MDKITAWGIVMFQGIHNLTRIGYIHQRVLDNPSSQRFPDERGSATQTGNKYLGNELDHIINEQGSDRQFDWFVPDKAEGLTQAGLSRINQSIEAFVYFVLRSTGKRSQQYSW